MKYIDAERITAEINKIIEGLKRNCNPDPMGTTEECMTAAEIEALELVKGIIAKMKQEEPINEDLLDEIHNRWEDDPHTKWPKCPYKDFKNIAFHFANWQKKQDADLGSSAYEREYHDGREYEKGKSQKSNQDNSELADIEDSEEVKRVAEKWVRTYEKIYEKGKSDIKKEMLKDAITTEIVNGWEYGKDEDHAKIPTIHIKGGINFSIGDKVRVIIIKED